MEEILRAAAALGKLIAASETFKSLRAAEAAVHADTDARKLLESFHRQRLKIENLEAQGRPVEPEDKRLMQSLSDSVHGNSRLQELMRCQADFIELMRKVDMAVREGTGERTSGTPAQG